MKLQRLKLENFQGIKALELSFPEGCSATIYGDNATGKTTTFNAMTWLLFDKASTDIKGFTPKTKGPQGDLHHLEHSVEGEFIADDGRIVRLKKSYAEVYTKKRGSNTEEFTGHSVSYEIDGVPAKEKEYTKRITDLCGGDTEKPKYLTMPNYFPERISWSDRRELLLEICGDVSDEDVIASNKDLQELKDFLLMPGTSGQYYAPDEYKKIAESTRKAINKQLAEIPARIDELNRSMPEAPQESADELQVLIDTLSSKRNELVAAQASPEVSENVIKLRREIAAINLAMSDKKAEHAAREAEADAEYNKALTELRASKNDLKAQLMERMNNRDDLAYKKERLAKNREELVEEYSKAKALSWSEASEYCPVCKQKLPANQIEQLKADFNLRKSQKLEDINKRGKESASQDAIKALEKEISKCDKEIDKIKEAVEKLDKKLLNFGKEAPAHVEFKQTEVYAKLLDKRVQCENELREAEANSANDNAQLAIQIESIKTAITEAGAKLNALDMRQRAESRIAELEEEESALGEEYEKAEQGIYLCELFTRTKVNMLTEKINSKFKTVSFRLFVEQINGGVKEDCEVLIPADGRMVPYTFANNAARINAGLEIIGVLSAHWGITMPVFVDNAEAVTHLVKTAGQTIRLVVSEPDKKLRVELEKE